MEIWMKQQSPSMEQKRETLRGVLKALDYLHKREIIHCDVHLKNILMDADNPSASPVLAGFDLSCNSDEQPLTASNGTAFYMAPEIVHGQCQTKMSDMFAFGAVTMLTISSNCPADLADWQSVEADLPPDAENFLSNLLANNPSERKQAQEMLQHPFVAVHSIVIELEAQRLAAQLAEAEAAAQLDAERASAAQSVQDKEEKKARQKAEKEVEIAALQRECCICLEQFGLFDGIECKSYGVKHFICDEDFARYVETESDTSNLDLLGQRDACVFCPNKIYGCEAEESFSMCLMKSLRRTPMQRRCSLSSDS